MSAFDPSLLLTVDWPEIGGATLDTLTMLGVSLLFTIVLGLPLGVLLYISAPGQLRARPRLYAVMSFLVNVLRSLPFVILLIVLIPLTLLLVGTSIGVANGRATDARAPKACRTGSRSWSSTTARATAPRPSSAPARRLRRASSTS